MTPAGVTTSSTASSSPSRFRSAPTSSACSSAGGASWAKLSGPGWPGVLANAYTTICRSVPEILLIIILFYAGQTALNWLLPRLGFGNVGISGFAAAVTVLGLVQGAYASEILRGAVLAIPKGQTEAARAYGIEGLTRFRRMTVPAILPYALPGLANLWMIIIKDFHPDQRRRLQRTDVHRQAGRRRDKVLLRFYLLAGVALLRHHPRLERRHPHDRDPAAALDPEGWHDLLLARAIWPLLHRGRPDDLLLVLYSGVLGFALAVAVGIGRTSRNWLVNGLCLAFTSIIRGTPLLVQIFLLYYGVGSVFGTTPWIRQTLQSIGLWRYLRDGFLVCRGRPHASASAAMSARSSAARCSPCRAARWRRRGPTGSAASGCSGGSGCRGPCRR